MIADDFETSARGFVQIALVVQHRQRRRRDSRGGQLALDLGPERQLGVGAIHAAGGFVGGIHGGHPDDLRAGTAGQFHSHRIQSAHAVIQRDGAESLYAGHGFGDHFGAFRGRKVVRLENESLEAALQKFMRQVDVVNAPLDDVRRDMNL